MTVASEITRLNTAKSCLKASIEAKWVTVWSSLSLSCYYKCVDAIPTWSNIAIVDILLIGWWWGGWRSWNNSNFWWGGGAGDALDITKRAIEAWTYPVTIWAWWAQNVSWWASCFDWIVALWGGAWWSTGAWCCWGNWWWAVSTWAVWVWNHNWGKWCANSSCGWYWGWWGGGSRWTWGDACMSGGSMYWWLGWLWLLTCITWHNECFAWGWWGRWYYGWQWCYWWWDSTGSWAWGNGHTCWSWWWWAPAGTSSSCKAWSWAWWVLIIAYPSWCDYNITGANCSCTCNWVCVHCFTSNGTLTIW